MRSSFGPWTHAQPASPHTGRGTWISGPAPPWTTTWPGLLGSQDPLVRPVAPGGLENGASREPCRGQYFLMGRQWRTERGAGGMEHGGMWKYRR